VATEVLAAVERSDDLFDAKRLAMVIGTALSRLPARQRDAFELVKVEGRSTRQAAAELGTTEVGLRLRVHHATSSLRRAIATATSHHEKAPPDQSARRRRESRWEAGAPAGDGAGRRPDTRGLQEPRLKDRSPPQIQHRRIPGRRPPNHETPMEPQPSAPGRRQDRARDNESPAAPARR
jgi:hypothetical protein